MQTIDLVLVRHGEAGSAPVDEYRSLTEAGRAHVRQVGALLAAGPEAIDLVICSPLVRAVQTAELVTSPLAYDGEISARAEIAFPARLEQVLEVVDEAPAWVRGVMVIGHEPTMGLLARQLLGPAGATVGFRTGTALSLRWRRGEGHATARCLLSGRPPERVPLGAP